MVQANVLPALGLTDATRPGEPAPTVAGAEIARGGRSTRHDERRGDVDLRRERVAALHADVRGGSGPGRAPWSQCDGHGPGQVGLRPPAGHGDGEPGTVDEGQPAEGTAGGSPEGECARSEIVSVEAVARKPACSRATPVRRDDGRPLRRVVRAARTVSWSARSQTPDAPSTSVRPCRRCRPASWGPRDRRGRSGRPARDAETQPGNV